MKALVKIVMLLVLLVSIGWLAQHHQEILAGLQYQLSTMDGRSAMLIFILAFVLGSILFIPASVFIIAAGAIFGLYTGYLLSMTGFTLGACSSFLISRYLARELTRKYLPARALSVIASLHEHGWKLVAMLRLFCMIPAPLISYALGITHIRLSSFTLASFVFTLPVGFLLTYAGVAGKEFIESGELQKLLLSLAAFAFVSLCIFLLRHRYMQKQKASV